MKPQHFVYFDSTRKTFSVKDLATGKVCLKSPLLEINDCHFKVSEIGRQRVLRTGVKSVHAGITGSASVPVKPRWGSGMSLVRYNPRHEATFVRASDGVAINAARRAICVVRDGRAQVFVSPA